jgi:hypothetical protein
MHTGHGKRQNGGYLRCAQVMVNYTALGEASPAAVPRCACVDRLWCQVAPRVRNLQSAQLRDRRANSNMIDGAVTAGERSPSAAALRDRAERRIGRCRTSRADETERLQNIHF